jgi:hypothetical protein
MHCPASFLFSQNIFLLTIPLQYSTLLRAGSDYVGGFTRDSNSHCKLGAVDFLAVVLSAGPQVHVLSLPRIGRHSADLRFICQPAEVLPPQDIPLLWPPK